MLWQKSTSTRASTEASPAPTSRTSFPGARVSETQGASKKSTLRSPPLSFLQRREDSFPATSPATKERIHHGSPHGIEIRDGRRGKNNRGTPRPVSGATTDHHRRRGDDLLARRRNRAKLVPDSSSRRPRPAGRPAP